MANPEHIEILNQGVSVWNVWLQEQDRISHFRSLFNKLKTDESAPEIDIHRALRSVSIADLSDAELNYKDFTGIDLSRVNLNGARLSHVNFSDAHLNLTKLHNADLKGVKFINSDVRSASLHGANLEDAKIVSSDFRNVNLTGACLAEAVIDGTDLSDADLEGADFSRVMMLNATFGSNDLSKAKGLNEVRHLGRSLLGIDTFYLSKGDIPELFLRGCGVPEDFITYMRSLTAKAIEFYSCFISYSSKDQEFAERLHADLQAKGVRVWFAPHDLPIGAKIRPAIDESIRIHDKLLLVLSEASVGSQWVEQEVETALAREREQEGRTVLFPIRIDDSVMEIRSGWPALLKNTRNVGDFTRWKDHDSYQKALERLLRDLKTEVTSKPTYMTPDSLENRAVLSPRDTIREGWKGVESSVIEAAKRNRLVSEGELVDCGLLVNQLYELGKISEAVREDYFLLSKWHRSVAFDSFSSVEPRTAINFVNRAGELQKALAVDTPSLP